jgi:WD40 repeat protein
MHSAPVEAIATDSENRFMVTGGRDKVARVWSLPDLELLQMLRPPIGTGEEGRIDALAVSPDGNLVAVGGFFCSYEKTHCIFIFERASGRIVKRVSGFRAMCAGLRGPPMAQ